MNFENVLTVVNSVRRIPPLDSIHLHRTRWMQFTICESMVSLGWILTPTRYRQAHQLRIAILQQQDLHWPAALGSSIRGRTSATGANRGAGSRAASRTG